MNASNPEQQARSKQDGGPRDRIVSVLTAPDNHGLETPVSDAELQAAVKLSDAVYETALNHLLQDGCVRYVPDEGYTHLDETRSATNDTDCAICSEPITADSYAHLSIETHRRETTVVSEYDAHRSCLTPILDLVDEFTYPYQE